MMLLEGGSFSSSTSPKQCFTISDILDKLQHRGVISPPRVEVLKERAHILSEQLTMNLKRIHDEVKFAEKLMSEEQLGRQLLEQSLQRKAQDEQIISKLKLQLMQEVKLHSDMKNMNDKLMDEKQFYEDERDELEEDLDFNLFTRHTASEAFELHLSRQVSILKAETPIGPNKKELLESEVECLEEKCKELKQADEQRQKDIEDAREELQHSTSLANNTRIQLTQVTAAIEELTAQLRSTVVEEEKLSQKQGSNKMLLETEATELITFDDEEANRNLHELQNDKQKIQMKLHQEYEKWIRYKDDSKYLQTSCVSTQAIVKRLQKSSAATKIRNRNMERELQKRCAVIESLKTISIARHREAEFKKEKKELIEDENIYTIQKIATMRKQVDKSSEILMEKFGTEEKLQLKTLTQDLRILSDKITFWENKNSRLRQKFLFVVSLTKQSYAELEKAITMCKKTNEEIRRSRITRKRLLKEEADLMQIKDESDMKLEKCQKEKDTYHRQLEDLTGEIQEVHKIYKKVGDELQALKDVEEEQNQQLEDKLKLNTMLLEKRQDVVKELDRLSEVKTRHTERYQVCSEELVGMKRAIKDVNSEVFRTTKITRESRKENEEMEMILAEKCDVLIALQEKENGEEVSCRKVEDLIAVNAKKIQEQKRELERCYQSLKSSQSTVYTIPLMYKQMKDISLLLQIEKDKATELNKSLDAALEEKNTPHESHEYCLEETQNTVKYLKKQIDVKERALMQYEEETKALVYTSEKLRSHIHDSESGSSVFVMRFNELRHKFNEIEKQHSSLRAEINITKVLMSRLHGFREKYLEKVRHLRDQSVKQIEVLHRNSGDTKTNNVLIFK